jgi:hypothetical protein
MNTFALILSAALIPFGLVVLLLLARPFLLLVRKLPDGRVKRLLLWHYS